MYSCEPIYVPSLRFDPGGGVRYVVFINCLSSLTIFDDLNFTMRVFALAVFSGYSRVKEISFQSAWEESSVFWVDMVFPSLSSMLISA